MWSCSTLPPTEKGGRKCMYIKCFSRSSYKNFQEHQCGIRVFWHLSGKGIVQPAMFFPSDHPIPGKRSKGASLKFYFDKISKVPSLKLLLSRKKSLVSVHLGAIISEIRRKSFAYTVLSWLVQLNNFIGIFQSCGSINKSCRKINKMPWYLSVLQEF